MATICKFYYFADFLRLTKNSPAAAIMIRQPAIVKIVVPMPPVEGRAESFVFITVVTSSEPVFGAFTYSLASLSAVVPLYFTV